MFTVPINNAIPFTATKTFAVSVSSPSNGATLSTPNTAGVTITGSSGVGSSGSSGGSSGGPSSVKNVYVILQGETAGGLAQMGGPPPTSTKLSPNFNELGWTCVSNASSYNIYRATNGGSYSLYASTTASQAAGAYSTYVSNQGSNPVMPLVSCAYADTAATNVVTATKFGTLKVTGNTTAGSNVITVSSVATGTVTVGQGIGGPGIPQGTTISAFGSGGTTGTGNAGTYQLSQSATSTNSAATYGTLFFPNNGYTYYVTAVANGVESSASAYAQIPFIVNGEKIMSSGVFNGIVTWDSAAPAQTPLGFSDALYWQGSPANSIINPFSGSSSASQNLGIAGYNYLILSFYTTASGQSMKIVPEIAGDQALYNNAINLSNFGPSSLTANAWTTYKIPLSQIYEDMADGTNVLQTAFYKITIQYNYGSASQSFYVEGYFSVN
jgi:hypothetical protein